MRLETKSQVLRTSKFLNQSNSWNTTDTGALTTTVMEIYMQNSFGAKHPCGGNCPLCPYSYVSAPDVVVYLLWMSALVKRTLLDSRSRWLVVDVMLLVE